MQSLINRLLDGRIVMMLSMRADLARSIIKTIEGDNDNQLPFYSSKLRDDMLDMAHRRLQELAQEAKRLYVHLPMSQPVSTRITEILNGMGGHDQFLSKSIRLSPMYKVDALCRFSTLLDIVDCERFMYAIGLFNAGQRVVLSEEIKLRLSNRSPVG